MTKKSSIPAPAPDKGAGKQQALQSVLANIEKKHGKNAVIIMDEDAAIAPVPTIPTGSIGLDIVIGIGGVPRGRVVEIYGPESCLAEDTFISYSVVDKSSTKEDKRQNHKGGTIRRLYERFHGIKRSGQGFYQRSSTKNSEFQVTAVNEEGRIINNEVLDVVKTGKKQCFHLKTSSGYSVRSTAEHKFLTDTGFVPLSELREGDQIFIHNNTRYKKTDRITTRNYKEVMVKYHPSCKTKKVNGYTYYRMNVCAAVIEAAMNNMSYESYISALNTWSKDQISTLELIPTNLHIHHINENWLDNSLDNLLLVSPSEHGKIHSKKRHNNLQFTMVPTKITEIEQIPGELETYDIKCKFPHNNYIANGIVVHNSGKSTLAFQIIAQCQKTGGTAALIDAENAYSPSYGAKLGIDPKKLLFNQPDSGEQALDIVEQFVASGAVDCVVIDSVAALVPRAELEGEMGDAHMGLQARLMGQALRKLTPLIGRSGCCLIFINQLRCLEKNTKILVRDKGLIPLSKVEVGDYIPGSKNYLTQVTGVTPPENMSGVELTTRYRGNIKISSNHRQQIIGINGLTEKVGEDVVPGDFLIQPNGHFFSNDVLENNPLIDLTRFWPDNLASNAKKVCFPKYLNEDVSFLLGCWYSDGSFVDNPDKSDYRVQFTENNEERFALVREVCTKLFGDSVSTHYPMISLGGSAFLQFFKELGCNRYGVNKEIPPSIFSSKSDVVKSFIRGCFFDTHGFDQNGFIFSNENQTNLQDFAELLYHFGIFADLRKDKTDWYNRLFITGNDAIRFRDTIGFAEPSKKEKALKFSAPSGARGKYDIVPFSYGLFLYEKLKSNNIKRLTSAEYYNSFNQIRFLAGEINFSRLGLISLLKEVAPEFTEEIYFLENNRFTEVLSATPISMDAIDLEVGKGEFVASQFLTHNSKIGIVFGSPEVTPGGNALKFYSSVRLDVRRLKQIKVKDDIIGNEIRIKVVKNKMGPPLRTHETEIIFGKGIDPLADLLGLAITKEIITKKGPWFYYGEASLGQGKESAKTFLTENEKDRKEIEKLVYQAYNLNRR